MYTASLLRVSKSAQCRALHWFLPAAHSCHMYYFRPVYRCNFSSDDTLPRFKHVRDTLPIAKNVYDENIPSLEASTTISYEERSHSSDDNKIEKAQLKTVTLKSIEDAVLQFVPESINSGNTDDAQLSPGQAFYLENRDKLFDNIRRRYYEETKEVDDVPLTDSEIESLLPLLMEEEEFGSYDPDLVAAPSKHHLWDYTTNDIYVPKKTIHLHKNKMPTLQDIVDILEQERMTNIAVVDMDSCNRRDQSMYCIVATGTTRSHCRRVGRMLYRVIVDLEVPFVSATSYCCSSRSDEWIVARLGPLCVHLMVQQVRDKQSIEQLWDESRAVESSQGSEQLEEH